MTRGRIIGILMTLGVLALVVWVARHTYWGEVSVPMPLQGEARQNPLYAAQRLAERLGARVQRGGSLSGIGTDAVIMLSEFAWDVSSSRRGDLEQWVESGGRLIVDQTLITGSDAFAAWSGVFREEEPTDSEDFAAFGEIETSQVGSQPDCPDLVETRGVGLAEHGPLYGVCSLYPKSWLRTQRRATWRLENDIGPQVVRVNLGLGSVTVINGTPFPYRGLLRGDHAALFVAATQLQERDDVFFLSEDDHDSLLTLTWRLGAPVVALFLLFVALALWRGMQRFGPLVAAPDAARRSLAEQVRGTGRFALRWGDGAALHTAVRRSLTEAAARRIAGYERMSEQQRIVALAQLTSTSKAPLTRAIRFSSDRAFDLLSALALLESVRRQILGRKQSKHGQRI